MRIIEPIQITPAMLTASNIPETDQPAWASATSYSVGQRCLKAHAIWECVQAHTNKDPESDSTQTYWFRVGATNRWRAFDNRLGGKTVGGATITYTITLLRTLDAIAFFGLNATDVRIKVIIPGPTTIYDQTFQLADRPTVGNFYQYVHSPFEFRADLILTGLTMPSGAAVEITITAGAAAEVAEILFGSDIGIGTTLVDTSLGIVDYSKKDRDEWGGVYLVPRPVTKTVRFRFRCDTADAARVQQIIQRVTSKLCVFYAVEGEDPFGATIAGILRDYELTLGTDTSFGSIDAESMT